MPRLRAPLQHGAQAVSPPGPRQCPPFGTGGETPRAAAGRREGSSCEAAHEGRARGGLLYVEHPAEGANEANGPLSAACGSVQDRLGRIRRVVVEAAPGLAPEVAALDA